jgi:hypothetical protein
MLSTKKKITAAHLDHRRRFRPVGVFDGLVDPEATTPAAMEQSTPSATAGGMSNDPAANLVGPGCAAYAEAVPSGAGSVEGMSKTRWRSRRPTTRC